MDAITGVKDVVQEIMPYLEKVGESLGTTARYLWELQIKQAGVTGAYYIICWAVWLLATGLAIYATVKLACYANKTNNNKDYEVVICAAAGLGMILFSWFLFVPGLKETFTVFFNPEYWALQEMLKTLKSAVK